MPRQKKFVNCIQIKKGDLNVLVKVRFPYLFWMARHSFFLARQNFLPLSKLYHTFCKNQVAPPRHYLISRISDILFVNTKLFIYRLKLDLLYGLFSNLLLTQITRSAKPASLFKCEECLIATIFFNLKPWLSNNSVFNHVIALSHLSS